MKAALTAGVERVVYTSCVADAEAGRQRRRRTCAIPQDRIGAYKRSKLVAERLVERMIATRACRP